MEVILKEKIKKLGNISDIVKVKKGYAKNFLIPNNKALYATKPNIELLNSKKVLLEKEYNEKLNLANQVAKNLYNKAFIFIRNASEAGALYGSVTARNVVEALEKGKISISSHQVKIKEPIKSIGTYDVSIELHSYVVVNIVLVVARSIEDAENMYKVHIDKLKEATQQIDTSEKNKSTVQQS